MAINDRDTALTEIRAGLALIDEEIRRTIPQIRVQFAGKGGLKLLITSPTASVKVEPSPIMRGSLFPPVQRDLCQSAQDEYELFVRAQRLATEDLYAGKLCAALDRQHPRDLFDLKQLHDAGGISDGIRQAFVAYVAAHRRPMAELIAPNAKSIEQLFIHHFAGMTDQEVELDELEAVRAMLFAWTSKPLSDDERKFLLSVKRGEPEWDLMPFEGLERWPPIQWKLLNVKRMSTRVHETALNRLQDVLGL